MNNEVQVDLATIKERLGQLELEMLVKDSQINSLDSQINSLNLELSSKEEYIKSLEKELNSKEEKEGK